MCKDASLQLCVPSLDGLGEKLEKLKKLSTQLYELVDEIEGQCHRTQIIVKQSPAATDDRNT